MTPLFRVIELGRDLVRGRYSVLFGLILLLALSVTRAYSEQGSVNLGTLPDKPPPSGSPPDLTGTWLDAWSRENFQIDDPIPFQPWTRELHENALENQRGQVQFLDNLALCQPPGPVDILWTPYAIHILQTPEEITLLYELNHEVRRVFMNQEHPPNLQPTWWGHSVGFWEGDTLVVDTVGFNDKTPILTAPESGQVRRHIRHSETLHLVERWSLSEDRRTLRNQITVDDPLAFTRPWGMTFTFTWRPDLRPVDDECNEDNFDVQGH